MARQRSSWRPFWLCREGLYYSAVFIAVLAGAVSRQLNLLMLLGSVLAGPLVFSLIHGRLALRKLKVERKLPAQMHAGGRLRVEIGLTNARRWLGLWAIRVEDRVVRQSTGGGEPTGVAVFFPRVAAGVTRQVAYEGLLTERGLYRFGPLRVSTRFPLGLVRHNLVLDQPDELVVHPRIGRLTREWTRMMREHEAGSERMQRRGLLEADFHGLREWRPGDSRRWIHWRTSARRGALIVRQFEQHRSQNLAILLDLWQPAAASEAQREHLELAVSFAATLVGEACRRPGCQVTLQVAAREPLERSGPASPVFFREQMDALALSEPHHEAALPTVLGHALALVPAATTTIVISTREIDTGRLSRAASERGTELGGRKLHLIDTSDNDLASYFEP